MGTHENIITKSTREETGRTQQTTRTQQKEHENQLKYMRTN